VETASHDEVVILTRYLPIWQLKDPYTNLWICKWAYDMLWYQYVLFDDPQ
jgi:hypothetical protein